MWCELSTKLSCRDARQTLRFSLWESKPFIQSFATNFKFTGFSTFLCPCFYSGIDWVTTTFPEALILSFFVQLYTKVIYTGFAQRRPPKLSKKVLLHKGSITLKNGVWFFDKKIGVFADFEKQGRIMRE